MGVQRCNLVALYAAALSSTSAETRVFFTGLSSRKCLTRVAQFDVSRPAEGRAEPNAGHFIKDRRYHCGEEGGCPVLRLWPEDPRSMKGGQILLIEPRAVKGVMSKTKKAVNTNLLSFCRSKKIGSSERGLIKHHLRPRYFSTEWRPIRLWDILYLWYC